MSRGGSIACARDVDGITGFAILNAYTAILLPSSSRYSVTSLMPDVDERRVEVSGGESNADNFEAVGHRSRRARGWKKRVDASDLDLLLLTSLRGRWAGTPLHTMHASVTVHLHTVARLARLHRPHN